MVAQKVIKTKMRDDWPKITWVFLLVWWCSRLEVLKLRLDALLFKPLPPLFLNANFHALHCSYAILIAICCINID